LGFSPFSAKYFIAPGWKGIGDALSYCVESFRLAA